MKKSIMNVSGRTLPGMFAGIPYPVKPGETITVDRTVANHLIGQFRSDLVVVQSAKKVVEVKNPEIVKEIINRGKRTASVSKQKPKTFGTAVKTPAPVLTLEEDLFAGEGV